MNAVPVEAPKDAARRLAGGATRDGFRPVALHEYRHADGTPAYWRIRCKHPDTGAKWIRPMRRDGLGFAIGEPPAPDSGKLLYRLPELLADSAATVWIVEGENCADALAAAGMVATTSGGASSADAADWTPLRGRSVIVWPDHDGPGANYADAVAAHLESLGCAVQLVDVAALNLSTGGDAVDWLAEHPADDLHSLPLKDSQNRRNRSAPESLRRPIPPPEPYPLAELGPILQPAAESLRRVIQAPDAVCGASILAAASLATQALANVEIDGRIIPLSLWLLSIAESGERKSANDAEAMRAAREYEKELAASYETELRIHAADLEEWEGRRADAKAKAKKSNGAGLSDALQAIGPAPPAPLVPRVLVADFTAEGLAKLLAAGRPSVGVFTDEAALVFGGHGMTREAVARTAGTLSKLWDSGTLDRVRALDGATKLYGRRLALHLMAQPVIAERALSDDVLSGQGFLARCLLAWPEPTAGTRPYQPENLRDDPALERMASRLADLHRKPLPLAEGDRQELDPRPLKLTRDAKAAWITLHDAVEGGMRQGGPFAIVKPWASKTPEQALRIAGVLTLLESSTALEITAGTVARAAELALWHLHEAVRLASTAEVSPEVRDAEALLTWCHDTGRTLLYSTDALRLGPGRIRDRETFTRAIGELERAGWAEAVQGGMELDGRHRRNVWRIMREGG